MKYQSTLKRVSNQVLKWKVEISERFILRHFTQATTEDIFYSRKTLESNPKHETSTSFNITFLRLLTVSKTKTVDLKSVLSHLFSVVPLSIFYPIGEQRKLAKSKLLHELKTKEYSIKTVGFHNDSASILDFMEIIQWTIQTKAGTFG